MNGNTKVYDMMMSVFGWLGDFVVAVDKIYVFPNVSMLDMFLATFLIITVWKVFIFIVLGQWNTFQDVRSSKNGLDSNGNVNSKYRPYLDNSGNMKYGRR